MQPSVAVSAPGTPASLVPTNVAALIAIEYFVEQRYNFSVGMLIRLPSYDFTPVIEPAFDSSFLSVRSLASGIPNSHGVTGGVYKTRERIHRSILICDY